MIPSSATQVLVTLVLIVPGFVFQGVLIALRGRTPSDADLSSRIMRAIVTSTIFGLIYIAAAAPEIVSVSRAQDEALEHLRRYALAGFAAAIGIPALTACGWHLVRTTDWWKALVAKVRPSNWTVVDPRPSGWDVAFEAVAPSFVRVQMKDGGWYAGWFGENSYASSWPDPPTLFVELSYHVDTTGTIGDVVDGSAGSVIDCTEAVLVELLQPPTNDQP